MEHIKTRLSGATLNIKIDRTFISSFKITKQMYIFHLWNYIFRHSNLFLIFIFKLLLIFSSSKAKEDGSPILLD